LQRSIVSMLQDFREELPLNIPRRGSIRIVE